MSERWRPSHRRSEETGAILDRAFENETVVPTCDFAYPDDEQEQVLVKRFIAFLEMTKEEKFKLRRLAFLLLVGRVEMSFEELGKATGVSTSTARREFFRVNEFFRGGEALK